MDTKWLEDLIAIGKTGSLALAARQRDVTQPAFGRRIRAIETCAGVPLIDRSHRPVRLTEAGMKLLAQAQDILQTPGDTKAAGRRGSRPGHSPTLVTGRTLARSFVADWLVLTLGDLPAFGQLGLQSGSAEPAVHVAVQPRGTAGPDLPDGQCRRP